MLWFSVVRFVIGLKITRLFLDFFLDQSDVEPQEIVTCSHHTGFLALGSSCMYMYLNAIGSFKCLGIFDWPEE